MGLIGILFSFEGRINRRPLWGFWLIVSAINLAIIVVVYQLIASVPLPTQMMPEDIEKQLESLSWFNYVSLAFLWPSLALGIKRAHDRDRSGWFLLLFFVPLINLWPLIELACIAGTPGVNRFGSDPLPSAKPGLGWLILLGHLVLGAIQIHYTMQFFTVLLEQGMKVQSPDRRPAAPNGNPINTPGLRPSAI